MKGTYRDHFIPYLAGFFDGDGSISLSKKPLPTTNGQRFSGILVVSNLDPRPLLLMKERWDGHLSLIRRHNDKQRDIYRIHVSMNRGADMLRQMLPYLIVKKEQAELFIEFQEYSQ